MARRKTTEEFIAEARVIHGGRYDYSNVLYKDSKSKVIITCPVHGVFEQSPYKHTRRKQGCPRCGKLSISTSHNSNTEEFISKAKVVHNDLYSYSKVNYTNSKTKVTITCPIHGDFEQSPSSHLGGSKCPNCSKMELGRKRARSSTQFIERANAVHFNKYSYLKTIYTTGYTKVIITCPSHGEFEQTPNAHLRGSGCRLCYIDAATNTTEEIIERAKTLHNNKYDYSKLIYTGIDNKIIIICPKHGEFEQRVSAHLNGSGCPSCAVTGFDRNKPAILYYLKITTDDNQVLYKIGITNRTVNERFNLTDLSKIEVIKQKLYANGQDALNEEIRIKRKFKKHQYKGLPVLSSGNTELFTISILDTINAIGYLQTTDA